MDPQLDEKVSQFVGVTGASAADAKKYLKQYKRVDVAIDAFYNEPISRPAAAQPNQSQLAELYDKYKDPDSNPEAITAGGTIQLCEDLGVAPEDVVLLAVAYELQSPRMGEWTRQGWMEGWKKLRDAQREATRVDSITGMKSALVRLRDKLASDPEYFRKVYNYTFEFSRPPGQRSLGLEDALGFWGLLLPHGLQGGALAHTSHRGNDDDEAMIDIDEEGWRPEFTEWWFEFLQQRGPKGISKDTWQMFLDFVRTIDAKFEKYDPEYEFVEYARERLGKSA
ncbi:defective in Cullin neddylation protein 1 [Panus rudis PR-1116 ss-1]|nr:defective in Cullin neddylation protein 1 [Panus rudis PR-1116 ss-1]